MRFIVSVLVAAAAIITVIIILVAGLVPESPLDCRQVTRISNGSFYSKGLATIGGTTIGNSVIGPHTLNTKGVNLYDEILKTCPNL